MSYYYTNCIKHGYDVTCSPCPDCEKEENLSTYRSLREAYIEQSKQIARISEELEECHKRRCEAMIETEKWRLASQNFRNAVVEIHRLIVRDVTLYEERQELKRIITEAYNL